MNSSNVSSSCGPAPLCLVAHALNALLGVHIAVPVVSSDEAEVCRKGEIVEESAGVHRGIEGLDVRAATRKIDVEDMKGRDRMLYKL